MNADASQPGTLHILGIHPSLNALLQRLESRGAKVPRLDLAELRNTPKLRLLLVGSQAVQEYIDTAADIHKGKLGVFGTRRELVRANQLLRSKNPLLLPSDLPIEEQLRHLQSLASLKLNEAAAARAKARLGPSKWLPIPHTGETQEREFDLQDQEFELGDAASHLSPGEAPPTRPSAAAPPPASARPPVITPSVRVSSKPYHEIPESRPRHATLLGLPSSAPPPKMAALDTEVNVLSPPITELPPDSSPVITPRSPWMSVPFDVSLLLLGSRDENAKKIIAKLLESGVKIHQLDDWEALEIYVRSGEDPDEIFILPSLEEAPKIDEFSEATQDWLKEQTLINCPSLKRIDDR